MSVSYTHLDVYKRQALFTSGIISMAADACRIVSILAVIAVKNTGLALILLLVLPLFALFLSLIHISTRRGIAYAYSDKYRKKTLRLGDLLHLDEKRVQDRLHMILELSLIHI